MEAQKQIKFKINPIQANVLACEARCGVESFHTKYIIHPAIGIKKANIPYPMPILSSLYCCTGGTCTITCDCTGS